MDVIRINDLTDRATGRKLRPIAGPVALVVVLGTTEGGRRRLAIAIALAIALRFLAIFLATLDGAFVGRGSGIIR